MKKKYWDNPYQSDYWKAQQEMNKNDNEIAFFMMLVTFVLIAVGYVYLQLK
jgi:hypothetical protein